SGWTASGSHRTSTASTASRSWMAGWSTWPTRSAPDGDNRGFGVYSGLIKRGSQPMSRTLMAADKEVPQLSDERRKALNLAITQIEKTCGKGAIMRMGADSLGYGWRSSPRARSTSTRRSGSAASHGGG